MRTKIRTHAERKVSDRGDILAILDEALVAHVGFIDEAGPFVIPLMYARLDNQLYLHGGASGRLISVTSGAEQICVTITLLDGIVLARSAFKHSMNYRSVMIFGKPRLV
ncbi:MAG: pyridoxamine 5'-phosphate oxidase family protein, partial [Candidatus Eremiobacteraeota bacterium]|nr:pyridoxamine 5'-phosphate oxidase family protein [Candidatus Eremiobacteraeota bacterium]